MNARKLGWLVGLLGAAVLASALGGFELPGGYRGTGLGALEAARVAAAMPRQIPAPDSVKPLSAAELRALPRARVVRAIDGDTIELRGGERIRLIGVNTPESVDPRRPVQVYGKEAGEFTRRMVEGKDVRLEFDVERKDRYGRGLAYVFLPDGTFVNAELVRLGFAQAYRYPPNVRYADLFHGLQQEARDANRGLWGR